MSYLRYFNCSLYGNNANFRRVACCWNDRKRHVVKFLCGYSNCVFQWSWRRCRFVRQSNEFFGRSCDIGIAFTARCQRWNALDNCYNQEWLKMETLWHDIAFINNHEYLCHHYGILAHVSIKGGKILYALWYSNDDEPLESECTNTCSFFLRYDQYWCHRNLIAMNRHSRSKRVYFGQISEWRGKSITMLQLSQIFKKHPATKRSTIVSWDSFRGAVRWQWRVRQF